MPFDVSKVNNAIETLKSLRKLLRADVLDAHEIERLSSIFVEKTIMVRSSVEFPAGRFIAELVGAIVEIKDLYMATTDKTIERPRAPIVLRMETSRLQRLQGEALMAEMIENLSDRLGREVVLISKDVEIHDTFGTDIEYVDADVFFKAPGEKIRNLYLQVAAPKLN